MKPEPTPLAPPLLDWITTTPGMTRATAVITALDSSRRTWLTELPAGTLGEPPEVGRSRFATAAAESEPETMAVTSAIMTTGMRLRPRRSRGARSDDVALNPATVPSQLGRVGWLGGGP